VRSEDVADPQGKEVRQPQASGVGPLGRSISLESLATRGAVILGGDPANEPDVDAACASSLTSLDLKKEGIHSIIWATGFGRDYRNLTLMVSPATTGVS